MGQSENSHSADRTLSRRPFLAAAASLTGISFLNACASSQSEANTDEAAPEQTSASPSPTKAPKYRGSVSVIPKGQTLEFNPVDPVTVQAKDSKLDSVELQTLDAAGKTVKAVGEFNEDKSQWTSTEPLFFNSEYTLTWHASDPAGGKGTDSLTFSTVSAAYEADVVLNIVDGAQYGVGQIIQFNFSEPVVNKANLEKAISISGGGNQAGKFRWYSDYMLRYRPQNYWAANSSVKVQVKMLGLDIGNGMIGNANVTRTFRTGDKRYAFADNNTKTIKLYVNDKLVRENPITLGNDEWPSVVGQLVIMEQAESYYFNPSSLNLEKNDPHYYEPFWATNVSRLTQAGVFVHQALPTAFGSIGIANVSHGCIGMLPEDAKFFFDLFSVGDIVETQHTGYLQADPDDGYGDWNIPFKNYADENWRGNW
ncbi:MAG: Ig-like domain-containing protein [Rothia sp. (in: high G+C Gram-positive bacteria)]|nr:Ig-like domain-containing protein [Rothia sp. (in: high G+C Gram-positive bacteria)]